MLSGNIKKLELLKRSYPQVKKHAIKIGELTYKNLFDSHPEIQKLFINTPSGQAQRLMDAILLYCVEADNYNLFYDKLDNIAHVHISSGIKNEYYSFMKEAFINALHSVLKEEATHDLVHAWAYGFDSLSNELIHVENLVRKYKS